MEALDSPPLEFFNPCSQLNSMLDSYKEFKYSIEAEQAYRESYDSLE